jgi:hypothetical protein
MIQPPAPDAPVAAHIQQYIAITALCFPQCQLDIFSSITTGIKFGYRLVRIFISAAIYRYK